MIEVFNLNALSVHFILLNRSLRRRIFSGQLLFKSSFNFQIFIYMIFSKRFLNIYKIIMNNLLVRDVKYRDEQYRIGEGIISDDAFKQLVKEYRFLLIQNLSLIHI